jgi:DNA-binding transcriptional regulator PaaX
VKYGEPKSVSLKMLAWIVPLSREQKLVLAYLGATADKANDQAWPSKSTLMRRTGLDEEELRVALAELKRQGFVTWEKREKASNLYTLHRVAMEARAANEPKAR